jgi:hypothetical protein
LPDGLFSNQKSQFWQILEVLAMEESGIFYCHLVNFPAIWYSLWNFDALCGHLVYFPRFGILYHEKSGNPDPASDLSQDTQRGILLWKSEQSNLQQIPPP